MYLKKELSEVLHSNLLNREEVKSLSSYDQEALSSPHVQDVIRAGIIELNLAVRNLNLSREQTQALENPATKQKVLDGKLKIELVDMPYAQEYVNSGKSTLKFINSQNYNYKTVFRSSGIKQLIEKNIISVEEAIPLWRHVKYIDDPNILKLITTGIITKNQLLSEINRDIFESLLDENVRQRFLEGKLSFNELRNPYFHDLIDGKFATKDELNSILHYKQDPLRSKEVVNLIVNGIITIEQALKLRQTYFLLKNKKIYQLVATKALSPEFIDFPYAQDLINLKFITPKEARSLSSDEKNILRLDLVKELLNYGLITVSDVLPLKRYSIYDLRKIKYWKMLSRGVVPECFSEGDEIKIITSALQAKAEMIKTSRLMAQAMRGRSSSFRSYSIDDYVAKNIAFFSATQERNNDPILREKLISEYFAKPKPVDITLKEIRSKATITIHERKQVLAQFLKEISLRNIQIEFDGVDSNDLFNDSEGQDNLIIKWSNALIFSNTTFNAFFNVTDTFCVSMIFFDSSGTSNEDIKVYFNVDASSSGKYHAPTFTIYQENTDKRNEPTESSLYYHVVNDLRYLSWTISNGGRTTPCQRLDNNLSDFESQMRTPIQDRLVNYKDFVRQLDKITDHHELESSDLIENMLLTHYDYDHKLIIKASFYIEDGKLIVTYTSYSESLHNLYKSISNLHTATPLLFIEFNSSEEESHLGRVSISLNAKEFLSSFHTLLDNHNQTLQKHESRTTPDTVIEDETPNTTICPTSESTTYDPNNFFRTAQPKSEYERNHRYTYNQCVERISNRTFAQSFNNYRILVEDAGTAKETYSKYLNGFVHGAISETDIIEFRKNIASQYKDVTLSSNPKLQNPARENTSITNTPLFSFLSLLSETGATPSDNTSKSKDDSQARPRAPSLD